MASERLDSQIEATIEAIRKKDPRVYDENTTFYSENDNELEDASTSYKSKPKPMYLNDYHRRNLLDGNVDYSKEEEPLTYVQQQDKLRETVVREMRAATNDVDHRSIDSRRINENGSDLGSESDDGDSFLVKKASSQAAGLDVKSAKISATFNVQNADKDPETFLSNFMSARAWVPAAGSKLQPFESDDEEDDRRAEAFEEAYNLRFEDPKGSNEKLLSHARDAVSRYSVRKETTNSRKKARDSDRAKKEVERLERAEEKARLRKLRIADAEEKIKKIKDAAGLEGSNLDETWAAFLDEGWDDDRWEEEMRRRFGDEYYAKNEVTEDKDQSPKTKSKTKKPKWSDDIDIKDIVPDFEVLVDNLQHQSTPTNYDSEANESRMNSDVDVIDEHNENPGKSGLTNKQNRKQNNCSNKETRLQRRKIEQHVDQRLKVDDTLAAFGTKHTTHFRYRETSPITYGLTPHDILMATDGQLNQYVGLKKLAAFRDAEKKKKDKKRLGKKARLRQWRKETFGDENGLQRTSRQAYANKDMSGVISAHNERRELDISPGVPKKKRSRKGKHSTKI